MKQKRRKFDKQFKLEVVKRSLEDTTVKELAEELEIHPNIISRWRKQYLETEGEESLFPGNGNEVLTDEQKQIRDLQKTVRDKELELEILKKAIGIFSRKDRTYTNSLK